VVIIVDVLCGSVFLWTQLASWNFVLNGVCVALGKICFSNVSSWKLQIYSQLCSFHDYYLFFYSSSTCLLLLPCTFLPSPQSYTHSLNNFYVNRPSRFFRYPPPHLIFFKTCLFCVFRMLLILVPSFLISLFYLSMTLNFLAIRICDGNVIFLRHKITKKYR